MPSAPAVLIAFGLFIAGILINGRMLRRRLLARFRNDWGRPSSPRASDDDHVAEAWLELNASSDDRSGVDERTWADLDLDRVIATIDHTRTTLGRQNLYRRMRSGMAWNDSPSLETLTTRFQHDIPLREAVGMQLSEAGTSLGRGLWVLTRPDLIRVRWWYWAFPLLALAMLASIASVAFEPRALLVVVVIALINMGVRMATAWQVPGLLAPMRQLGPLITVAEKVAGTLKAAQVDLEIDASIQRLRPLETISGWVSRDPITSGDIAASIMEYLNLLFILDANALLFGARYLRELGPVLRDVAQWVGDVDAALSVASLRAEPRSWCTPCMPGRVGTRVDRIWHPLIEAPVANSVALEPGVGLIITGANMSGKSTYLRAIGIAAVLARAIDTCPASAWEGPLYRVRSLIGRADDLSAGKSYYQVEADGVVTLLQDAREDVPTIFLLDELLRGTNTIERLAAGESVLRALLSGTAGSSPHVVIVATHDGELVSMLAELYIPFHFRETIGAQGLMFDYLRQEGPASTRTAIALLEAAGAPEEVVANARNRAGQLDRVGPPT